MRFAAIMADNDEYQVVIRAEERVGGEKRHDGRQLELCG